MREDHRPLPETIITTAPELAATCETLAACPVLGFDTEFVGEHSYHPELCLLQVATTDRLYLIDPFTAGPLEAFWKLLLDPARVVVCHAAREEVRLCHLATGQVPANLFDLQVAAGLVGFSFPIGHGPLVQQLLKIQLSKGETLTEWRERPLTRSQIRYAFDDVRYLLPLWKKLALRLHELDRAAWLHEEMDRLKRSAIIAPAATEKFRKLRGAGGLDRRKLGTLRELYAWREKRAAEVNRPARTVVRDDLLVEIVKRNPRRAEDLSVVRGLGKREIDAILEVVERARHLPSDRLPDALEREQEPPQNALIAHILTAVLSEWCGQRHLSPSLVCGASELKALVRARQHGTPPPDDLLLTRGWRAAHVLPTILAVLDGRRGLRITDVNSETPFTFIDAAK